MNKAIAVTCTEAVLTEQAVKLFVEQCEWVGARLLLNCLCMGGDNDKAMMLSEVMSTSNVEHTQFVCGELIGAYCQAGNLRKARL
ncbi:hypothetical protein V6N13_143926 [Hibiscus sabdariffa]|uniref:Pentatricopeptide repeat-containing protein n=1 Tax=Hibiscus sabdariffa TaxID=183260 RepID=A0ABR2FIZ9_9ROSI